MDTQTMLNETLKKLKCDEILDDIKKNHKVLCSLDTSLEAGFQNLRNTINRIEGRLGNIESEINKINNG